MAKSRTVDAPATSDVYFGMVLCSFLAILSAIGLLVWELTGTYGWESTPAALSAPALPKVPSSVPAKADGNAMAPADAKPFAALTPSDTPAPAEPKPLALKPADATPAPALPGPIPSPLTIVPKPAVAPVPAPAQPVPASSGAVPGFEFRKR